MQRTLLAVVTVGAFFSSLCAFRAADPVAPPVSTGANGPARSGTQAVSSPPPSGTPAAPPRDWNPRMTPVVEAVRRVRDAVVNIHSERTAKAATEELFSHALSQHRVNGMGTGILIDPRGYIITNQHVVEDVQSIRVRLADGTQAAGRVLSRDPDSDLALIKIDVGRPLPTIPLGTASDLMVGETVIAVGNAYGYEHTVSVGVVSAVGRDVTLNKEVSYKALIQTDASINPGNSGGPLVNIFGDLVGVNVAIRAGAQGIGFAIPVDTMIRVAGNMMRERKGALVHGVAIRDDVQPSPDTPGRIVRTALVERVDPAGPGGRAGLQKGDQLVRVGDVPVQTSLDLERALLERNSGERVQVVVLRQGAEQKLELAADGPRSAPPPSNDIVWRRLGMKLQAVSADSVSRTHPQLHGGLVVLDLRIDGAAARAGIQRGDILVGLHQWEMLTTENVQFVLNHPDLASFNPLSFYILRAGRVHRGTMHLGD
jgi:serine protease Do